MINKAESAKLIPRIYALDLTPDIFIKYLQPSFLSLTKVTANRPLDIKTPSIIKVG